MFTPINEIVFKFGKDEKNVELSQVIFLFVSINERNFHFDRFEKFVGIAVELPL